MATHDQHQQQVAGALDDLGVMLRSRPSVRDAVMQRVTEHAARNGPPSPTMMMRWAGRHPLSKLLALAACVLVALLIWSPWTRGIGATEAFAAAIANVAKARTFSCKQVVTEIGDDGKPQTRETLVMFKEPHLERMEGLAPMSEVMTTDYAKKIRLLVYPKDKTATLQDVSTMYGTDPRTGQIKPPELGTHSRDEVARISAKAVKDLGRKKLGDREVRVLQSADKADPVTTVYLNPQDNKPVQVEINSKQHGWTFAYTDIRIDAEIDDALFSVTPPLGYAVKREDKEPVNADREMNGKMMAKLMRIMRECMNYQIKNDDKWPAKLEDLQAVGLDAAALKTLLAAPDSKDGKPVIIYRQPKPGEKDVIVVYEAPEIRRPGLVACGFSDCHAEIVNLERFEELMKKQSGGK